MKLSYHYKEHAPDSVIERARVRHEITFPGSLLDPQTGIEGRNCPHAEVLSVRSVAVFGGERYVRVEGRALGGFPC
ncbi:hypothetical protein EON76_04250 [bacterium]|nr:MAG: hypothetical protein EON76_04250 [bacterium]